MRLAECHTSNDTIHPMAICCVAKQQEKRSPRPIVGPQDPRHQRDQRDRKDDREHQVFTGSKEYQVFMASQVRSEAQVILHYQGRLVERDQLRCQEHMVTLEDEEHEEDKDLKGPEDQAGFLGQMHIKDYKIRQVPKGSKGCEPEGSSIQPALFRDGPSSLMKPTGLCSYALSPTHITLRIGVLGYT
jgi:hypothetical protein